MRSRFNIQIAVITAAANEPPPGFAWWTLGTPGHCAIRSPGRAILLGNLDKAECQELVQAIIGLDYPGVVSGDATAHWFVEHAIAMRVKFDAPIPQRVYVLTSPPRYPGTSGSARAVTAADAPLLFEWMTAFHREAVPHDPTPQKENIQKAAGSGRYQFWTVDGEPVSVAAINRRLPHTGAIGAVYTPPKLRGRGYAGSVTAAVADRIFAEGKTAVCLYTDLRNPASNHSYAKIGFTPHCNSWLYLRMPPAN
jgi:RimJ/RimL family protein N-acetyltransferase